MNKCHECGQASNTQQVTHRRRGGEVTFQGWLCQGCLMALVYRHTRGTFGTIAPDAPKQPRD